MPRKKAEKRLDPKVAEVLTAALIATDTAYEDVRSAVIRAGYGDLLKHHERHEPE